MSPGPARLAGRLVRSDDQELDLAESELALNLLGIEGKYFFGGLQNCLRDEGSALGADFDAAAEQVVQGLGVGALPAHFFFETARTNHGKHLRSKPIYLVRNVRTFGLRRRCQMAQTRVLLAKRTLDGPNTWPQYPPHSS
jgi:DNA-binding transcriptional LysR family regulator